MGIEVKVVQGKADLERFIRVPWAIYRADPHWVPPLLADRREVLDPARNPFYRHADVTLLLVLRNGEAVGRVSAHVDHEFNRFHGDAPPAGAFGFFEAQDADVARALLARAEEVLRGKGVARILGPLSFSTNEETGLLVDGFDSPPFVLMGHNPPSYATWIEAAGFTKAKDLYAWRYVVGEVAQAALDVAEQARRLPGLQIREVDWRHFDRDVRIALDVFNSAWSRNWGFVPFTEEEIAKAARDLKLILDPRIALIAEVHGAPAAISIAIPNVNEAIADLDGRLFPFGLVKLLWRLRVRRLRTARLALLGVKPEFRGSAGMGLSVLLYTEMHQRARKAGYTGGELSWTLEDNHKINAGIEFMGGKRYKTYRVYEKVLEGQSGPDSGSLAPEKEDQRS